MKRQTERQAQEKRGAFYNNMRQNRNLQKKFKKGKMRQKLEKQKMEPKERVDSATYEDERTTHLIVHRDLFLRWSE